METIRKIIGKFKTRPDIWFFFGFLFTFIFNIRKVLFFYPIQETFNEYTGVYIYLSDIFFFATILSWLFILLSNKYHFSSSKTVSSLPAKQLETCGQPQKIDLSTSSVTYLSQKATDLKIIPPILLLSLSFLSLAWSENKTITFYRSLRLFELFVLYIYIITSLITFFVNKNKLFHVEQLQTNDDAQLRTSLPLSRTETIETMPNLALKYFRAILLGFVFIMLFDHYLWDIWQGQALFWITCAIIAGLRLAFQFIQPLFHVEHFEVVKNKIVPRGTIIELKLFFFIIISLGLLNATLGILQIILQHSLGLSFLRESLISPDIPGVGKVIISSHKFIRAYGFFPHPNILGGFLLFSTITTMLYRKLFHVEQSSYNPFISLIKIVPRGTITTSGIILLIQMIALIFTFSKSAIIGFIIAMLYIFVPRGTFWKQMKQKLFHVEQWKKPLFVSAGVILLILLAFIFNLDFNSLFIQSLKERVFYLNVSYETIASHPLLGIGTGEFVDNFYETIPNLSDWQYQPVHNVFLLIYNELGILGFFLFISFITSLFFNAKRSRS